MRIFHDGAHRAHEGRFEMYRGALVPCYEVAARADRVVAELLRWAPGSIEVPPAFDDALLLRIHDSRYIEFLRGAWGEWVALDPGNCERDVLPSVWPIREHRSDRLPDNFAARLGLFSFDAGTPLTGGTWRAARAGADCALAAGQCIASGDRAAFALARPPGHHAGRDFFGGYCFINNAALAAQYLLDRGARRVAVLDVDYHHGNGTQSLFFDRADVFFASIHGDPRTEYPFYLGHADETGRDEGAGCNLNLPLPRGTGFTAWRAALASALAAIHAYGAEALVVSLGVDTFFDDPISGFSLQSADYQHVGADIARAGLPTVFVLEGGYAIDSIGVNVTNVLDGFESR